MSQSKIASWDKGDAGSPMISDMRYGSSQPVYRPLPTPLRQKMESRSESYTSVAHPSGDATSPNGIRPLPIPPSPSTSVSPTRIRLLPRTPSETTPLERPTMSVPLRVESPPPPPVPTKDEADTPPPSTEKTFAPYSNLPLRQGPPIAPTRQPWLPTPDASTYDVHTVQASAGHGVRQARSLDLFLDRQFAPQQIYAPPTDWANEQTQTRPANPSKSRGGFFSCCRSGSSTPDGFH